jgi:hypothetical protein
MHESSCSGAEKNGRLLLLRTYMPESLRQAYGTRSGSSRRWVENLRRVRALAGILPEVPSCVCRTTRLAG